MADKPPTLTSDPIGIAIIELRDLDDINDHISMRVILGNLVAAERELWLLRLLANPPQPSADLRRLLTTPGAMGAYR